MAVHSLHNPTMSSPSFTPYQQPGWNTLSDKKLFIIRQVWWGREEVEDKLYVFIDRRSFPKIIRRAVEARVELFLEFSLHQIHKALAELTPYPDIPFLYIEAIFLHSSQGETAFSITFYNLITIMSKEIFTW